MQDLRLAVGIAIDISRLKIEPVCISRINDSEDHCNNKAIKRWELRLTSSLDHQGYTLKSDYNQSKRE